MAFISNDEKTFSTVIVKKVPVRPQPVMYLDYEDDESIIAFLNSSPDAMDRLRTWTAQQLNVT